MSGDADFDEAVDVSDEVASDEDDERTPESVVPPASSPGWKAPSVGDLFADDDDDSDSDGEGMLGRDTASRLNGLLNHRSLGSANSNRPTGAAAIAGAPRPSSPSAARGSAAPAWVRPPPSGRSRVNRRSSVERVPTHGGDVG